MKVTITLTSADWTIDLEAGLDISIALDFHGSQPNAFSLPRASSSPFRAHGFVGDRREGGSANCESVVLNPHGNGTHTECVGHITRERVAVGSLPAVLLAPAVLVTVKPEALGASGERYSGLSDAADRVITRSALSAGLEQSGASTHGFDRALVVRTLPNPPSRRGQTYSGTNPAYFTDEAMTMVKEAGFDHLLVDLPSVDRENDGGSLGNHHLFWEHVAGQPPSARSKSKTITEMIFVPEAIVDGLYFLNLQVPNFVLDAAPSRPILFAPLQR